MRSIETLLRGLIDYAGLFPPASLDMSRAAANYRTYRRQRYSWVLGRFVVPLSELSTFALQSCDVADTSISIVSTPEQLNRLNDQLPELSVFELKITGSSEIALLRRVLPIQTIYVEASNRRWSTELFEALSEAKAGAKIRTGGIGPNDAPTPQEIVDFMAGCKRAKIPWKATSGLHHPFRGVHRLGDEPDIGSALMHGFINVVLAATLIYSVGDQAMGVELLTEESADNFAFDSDGVTWRDYRFTIEQIKSTRDQFAISFGSCSFVEPISDLQDLGLL